MDTAEEEGIHVDAALLERAFGRPGRPHLRTDRSGLRELRERWSRRWDRRVPSRARSAAPLARPPRQSRHAATAGPLAGLSRFHVAMALLLDEGEDDSLIAPYPMPWRREVLATPLEARREVTRVALHEPIGHYRASRT